LIARAHPARPLHYPIDCLQKTICSEAVDVKQNKKIMKTWMAKSIGFFKWPVIVVLIAFACDRNDEFTPAQMKERANQAAIDNAQIVTTTQDVLNVTSGAFAAEGISDGRATTGGVINRTTHGGDGDGDDDEDRPDNNCPSVITGSFTLDRSLDTLTFSGSLSIDFGDGSGCQDSTNVKRGKVTDTFVFTFVTAPRFKFVSSSQTIVFEGFSRGAKLIDGTFIVKAEKAGTSSIEFQGAKITFADTTSVSWDGMFTSVENNFGTLNTGDDTRTLTGSISGTSRDGAAFSANITSDVIFKFACFRRRDIPVSGTVDITMGATSSTVDFGDGRCDKVYTVNTDGTVVEHSFDEDHDSDDHHS
jgi:hypothetical protein